MFFLKQAGSAARDTDTTVELRVTKTPGFDGTTRVFRELDRQGGSDFLSRRVFRPSRVRGHTVWSYMLVPSQVRVHLEVLTTGARSDPPGEEVMRVLNATLRALLLHASPHQTQVTVAVAFMPGDKRFPSKRGEPLGPDHINGGVTFHHARSSFCLVYRAEEWEKVLLHELLHLFGYDFWPSAADVERRLEARYGVRSALGMRLSEAYNESIATLLYYAIHASPAMPLATAYEAACQYSIRLAAQLFVHYGYERMEDAMAVRDGKWVEHTHAFSYYVAKAAVLFHYPSFIAWWGKPGAPIRMQGQFSRAAEFCGMLEEWLGCRGFQSEVDAWIKRTKTKKAKGRTLRMLLDSSEIEKVT